MTGKGLANTPDMDLTIAIITAREKSEVEWIFESVRRELTGAERVEYLIIDATSKIKESFLGNGGISYFRTPPMPNIWSGRYRVTSCDWWSKPSSINTAICLCRTKWILFLDDRSVLQAGFFDAVRDAMASNYIMFGSYQKRTGMTVENGVIKNAGIIIGEDSRWQHVDKEKLGNPFLCGGEWCYGCVVLSPIEWLLEINGANEMCNGLGFEDVIMGLTLGNAGYPMKFDRRALLIEDRTPSEVGEPMKRDSKERHPHDEQDKAHTMLRLVKTMKRSDNGYDLRALRQRIQSGKDFPVPDKKVYLDWFDKTIINNL